MNEDAFCKMGLSVVETELAAVAALRMRIDNTFAQACRYILDCKGRIIVIGMGKSGHIGNKIAATMASTGTPAFFVHPGEASHGDFGMITEQDVVLAISNSGETQEILLLIPLLKRLGTPLIALTGKANSTLGQEADVNLDVRVDQEACPLGLAPTASTTAALVMGDALAIALLQARGFTAEDFALSHPGGNLGRRLLLHIRDIMVTGHGIPMVGEDALLRDALVEMSKKGLGMTCIVNRDQRVVGIYTDGDLRRTLDRGIDVHGTKIAEVMTPNPKTAKAAMLAEEAVRLMQNHNINQIVIVDEDGRVIGALNMHTLLRAGVV